MGSFRAVKFECVPIGRIRICLLLVSALAGRALTSRLSWVICRLAIIYNDIRIQPVPITAGIAPRELDWSLSLGRGRTIDAVDLINVLLTSVPFNS